MADKADAPKMSAEEMLSTGTELFKLFSSYIASGFSESQALYLIGQLLNSSTSVPNA